MNTEKIDAKLRMKHEYIPCFLILNGTVIEWNSKSYSKLYKNIWSRLIKS